jgi:integrase
MKDKETQQSIIDEVHRLTFNENPKIWLGIKWLATYISIRPGELVRLKERDIVLAPKDSYFIIPRPKEKKPKPVPILSEDAELIKGLPRGLPDLAFFRHVPGISGCKAGTPFGEKYFYKWWKIACLNLGIEGIDLYGGTRHSTVMALRKFATPEKIKRATMHSTNKAFERYFKFQSDEARDIYELAKPHLSSDQPVTNQTPPQISLKIP